MFDKTIFEAMLCGTTVLSCNKNLKTAINEKFIFSEDDTMELTEKLENLLKRTDEEKMNDTRQQEQYARENHTLTRLSESLRTQLKNSL
jgi:hypothetical protein